MLADYGSGGCELTTGQRSASPCLVGIRARLGGRAELGLAVADGPGRHRRWSPLDPLGDPLLDAVDLRGAHDFRKAFATWLEDAGIPARVIDELMGHEASTRGAQHLGSTMGTHCLPAPALLEG